MGPSSDHVDVLIIGAGPAGLTLASWFNHSNVEYRIMESRSDFVPKGRADALKCLSLQILDSIGMGNQVRIEARRSDETSFWKPDASGRIFRSITVPDVAPPKSVRQLMLSQGKIEELILHNIQKCRRDIKVDYETIPTRLSIDVTKITDSEAYPVTVQLQNNRKPSHINHLDKMSNGVVPDPIVYEEEQTVRAKYVIGCDGAHSWTRKHLNIAFEGEHTGSTWGVLDIIPKTNFPDIQKHCVIQSAESGNVLLVPREKNLVRFYAQLRTKPSSRSSASNNTLCSPRDILQAVQAALAPYELEYDYCDWWSVYRVGQRVAEKFSVHDRVFLAGDAIHTHSPKTGQGMNTGIQDAYNLGWKILACLRWNFDPSILQTYEAERRPVALDLIDFDRQYAHIWSRGTSCQESYLQNALQTTGLLIRYPFSQLVCSTTTTSSQGLATKLTPGMRLPGFQVICQSDGVPFEIHQLLRSDGRFRIIVFAGDISRLSQAERLKTLGCRLSLPNSCVRRFTPPKFSIDSRIEIITIHAAKRHEVELLDLPDILHPWSETHGWDYWKVFADDENVHGNHEHAYEQCGICEHMGCLVVVRPDGYLGLVTGLEDLAELDSFLGGFMPSFGSNT